MTLLRYTWDSRQCCSSTRFRASSHQSMEIAITSLSLIQIYNAQLKKKRWQLHLCGIQVPLGRPFSSRSSSRIPSKTLDWPSTGCIYITIRYVFGLVEKRRRGHLLPGRSHLRLVARALKVAARQIARDVRWKWLIEIGSSVIPRVQSLLGMLPQLNRGRKAARLRNRHVFTNYSEWINHRFNTAVC